MLMLCALLTTSCTKVDPPKSPPPGVNLQPAAARLQRYYREAPLKQGWEVTGVAAEGGLLLIMVSIPSDQATALMKRPAEEQFRQVAAGVCPGRDDAVWQSLGGAAGVKVLPVTAGNVFIEVDCPR